IYDRHIPLAEEVIAKEPFDAPKLIIDPSVKDFYAFTVDSFRLENYNYHNLGKKIPVAV
ncbi:MAG: thymidylate synthase, partial [Clostridia bacterium]|nr:thymidylate synthase [Clostridia bacterium]